jgi:hypothetical protein
MSAKEILEEANLQDTFWGRIIVKAELRGVGFAPHWVALAGSWTTCACGKVTANIPRDRIGSPRDYVLNQLGISFYSAICYNNYYEAASNLVAIEKRALIVAAQNSQNPENCTNS